MTEMSDKTPIPSDHGAALFGHAKDEARRNAKGHPNHQPGESREHAKAPLPELPWAVGSRVAPKTSDNGVFDVPGAVARPNAKRAPSATAAPGTTELGNPEHAPSKRRVAGKHGLAMHEEQRSPEDR